MMDNDNKAFLEMCRLAALRDSLRFSHFLNLSEQREAEIAANKAGAAFSLYGGQDDCERKMLGVSGESAPENREFPISCLLVSPRGARFSKPLEHRDVLGSLMALGIEREVIGDIVLRDGCAYVFCLDRMADYISGALEKIGNAPVSCSCAPPPAGDMRATREVKLQVSSPRLDAVIAHLFRLSRAEAQSLFRQRKVAVDDDICERPDYALKDGQVISVRGYGRARYVGVEGQSKKGKYNLLIELYA